MDWIINIFYWWPWITFWNDSFFLQFIIIYNTYLIFFTKSSYFTLFYLFLEFFYFGLFLSIFNLDLYTAFLWLTECVIVFISILMLFYLNVYGNVNKKLTSYYNFKYLGLFFSVIFAVFNYTFPSELEFYIPIELNYNLLWDDYYEALYNNKMNDIFGLFISYYMINSFEFIIIGVLLLFASVVCVNLNKFMRNIKANNYYELLTIYDIFADFTKFIFMRKQNLSEQNSHEAFIRIFKKKNIMTEVKYETPEEREANKGKPRPEPKIIYPKKKQ